MALSLRVLRLLILQWMCSIDKRHANELKTFFQLLPSPLSEPAKATFRHIGCKFYHKSYKHKIEGLKCGSSSPIFFWLRSYI